VETTAGKIGPGFFVAAGVAAALAGTFDINEPLHGGADVLGIVCLPSAALLIRIAVGKKPAWAGGKVVLRIDQKLHDEVLPVVLRVQAACVLNLARTRTFSAKDFAETREGGCRLTSSLAQELAPTMATWAKLVSPYAEMVARHVARLAKSGLGMTAPIGPKPSPKRTRITVRLRPIAPVVMPRASRSVLAATNSNVCRSCGAKLTVRKRVYCDRCLPEELETLRRGAMPRFKAAGPAKIAAMRAAGYDPTTTPEAQRRRAATASLQRKAAVAWRDDGSLDGLDFQRDILPKLQRLPVRVVAEVMGASISHGSKVRGGKLAPHKRHWKALTAAASAKHLSPGE
jgi:hypothetical protein